MNTHRSLLAWQECRKLVKAVYEVTARFPKHELYGLTSQLRRAVVSAAANIAEGYARSGPRETAHGFSIALGSLAEVDTLFAVSEDLDYIAAADLEGPSAILDRVSKLTFGLRRKLRTRPA